MEMRRHTQPAKGSGRRRLSRAFLALICLLALGLTRCTTTSESTRTDIPDTFLFQIPTSWEVVSERADGGFYQADLTTPDRHGRMLVGKLQIDGEIDNAGAYLHREHTSVIRRLREQTNVELDAEELVQWDNGIVGYRTKLRGKLDNQRVIIDGMIMTNGEETYFSYGLFTKLSYAVLQPDYESLVDSLYPVRGARVLQETAVSLAAGKHRR